MNETTENQNEEQGDGRGISYTLNIFYKSGAVQTYKAKRMSIGVDSLMKKYKEFLKSGSQTDYDFKFQGMDVTSVNGTDSKLSIDFKSVEAIFVSES